MITEIYVFVVSQFFFNFFFCQVDMKNEIIFIQSIIKAMLFICNLIVCSENKKKKLYISRMYEIVDEQKKIKKKKKRHV